MVTYFDRLMYLYPNTQGITYKFTKDDGTSWDDPYDGLVWENNTIAKPTKEAIESIDDTVVATELANRKELERKTVRNAAAVKDVSIVQAYQVAKNVDSGLTFSAYLDSLEDFSSSIDILP
jgi:hypothetical protein